MRAHILFPVCCLYPLSHILFFNDIYLSLLDLNFPTFFLSNDKNQSASLDYRLNVFFGVEKQHFYLSNHIYFEEGVFFHNQLLLFYYSLVSS